MSNGKSALSKSSVFEYVPIAGFRFWAALCAGDWVRSATTISFIAMYDNRLSLKLPIIHGRIFYSAIDQPHPPPSNADEMTSVR